MKNNILIHKNHNYNKILVKYIVATFPLIIYGFYKNGILLYLDKTINLIEMFKPIIFPLLGFIIGLIVNIIRKKELNLSPLVLYGLLVGMMMPINANVFLFSSFIFALLFFTQLLEEKFLFNYVSVIKLLIILVIFLLGNYNYANIAELSKNYAYSFADFIFGRQVGGVCSSSFIWIFVAFIYLSTDYYYKKDIPILSYFAYVLSILISLIFTKDFSGTLNYLVAASPIFAFVFIAPISPYSPYTSNGKKVFSVLIGVITALLTLFIGTFESALIAITLCSLFSNRLNIKFRQKLSK